MLFNPKRGGILNGPPHCSTIMAFKAALRNVKMRNLFSWGLGPAGAWLGIGLSVVFGWSALLHATEQPNILFLLSDDHSYPFVSCYGDTNVKTPNLDRLATEGMKFHRFFTAAPQCVLSRAALMTGRSPVAARMTRFSSPLPKDEITLPELLRQQAGYYTGVCGRSFHLDGSGRKPQFVQQVFDKYQLATFADRVDFLKGGSDEQVAGLVAEFLDARPADKPFFMWANFSDPHHVWNAAQKYRPAPASLQLPAHWPDLPGVREQVADYCAEINRLDERVGAVLSELQRRQLLDKTIIVFAGDNGAALPHGKGSLYDPGSNVPFIVRWPGVTPAATESRALVSGEDLAPTLLNMAGVEPPSSMSGVSIVEVLQGNSAAVPREYLFIYRGPHGSAPVRVDASNSPYDMGRAVRSARYKFIYNCTPWPPYGPVDSSGGAAWKQMQAANAAGKLSADLQATYFTAPRPVYELYDLETDPSELKNLSGQAAVREIEQELREALVEKMIIEFDHLPLPELLE
jgi:N-sulfoglucosamine sulfohydrolase